ncbi:hypothetical protein ACC792_31985 [Rhizobium ruizarguesonis]
MRRYILCAGMDYFHPTSTEFITYTHRRVSRLSKAAPRGEALRFDIFDFAQGTQTIRTLTWKGGVGTEKTERKQIARAIDPAKDMEKREDSSHGFLYVLKDGRFDIMSIVQVYEAAIEIGSIEPGTLEELSIFSHSYNDGPILTNSYDDRAYTRPARAGASPRRLSIRGSMRDPDDKDCRAAQDFVAPTMDEKKRRLFHNAFSKSGRVWIWGCTFDVDANLLLSTMRRGIAKTGGIGAGKIILQLTSDEQLDAVLAFNDILKLDRAVLRKSRKLETSLDQIKRLMWIKLASTYPYAAAAGLRVPVIGAAYGTFAEPEGKLGLMRVSGTTRQNVRFYKDNFGMRTDPEGRDYFVFKHDMKGP